MACLAIGVEGRPCFYPGLRSARFSALCHSHARELWSVPEDVELQIWCGTSPKTSARAQGTEANHRWSRPARLTHAAGPYRRRKKPRCLAPIVIEHLVAEAVERAVVYDEQDTERSIIQLIGRDVAGKVRQRPIEIRTAHVAGGPFSPRSPPSFGWWRREQTPGDPATSANWPLDRASHLPRPVAPPRMTRCVVGFGQRIVRHIRRNISGTGDTCCEYTDDVRGGQPPDRPRRAKPG